MSVPWGFFLFAVTIIGGMFAMMTVEVLLASLIGRFCGTTTRAETAEQRAREVELDAWIDETLRSGR